MSSGLFERYRDLQVYVGWSDEDAARIKAVAELIRQHSRLLIDDFYEEIERHPDASRVITGGPAQIARLKASLTAWLSDALEGPGDADYVTRRWKIGLRHAEIGLNPAYASAAMARLRNGIVDIIAKAIQASDERLMTAKSLNKLLDLDLTVIHDAYHTEYLRKEKLVERERGEVRFRMLVEAAACMVVILRLDGTIAYFSPYCEELTGYNAKEILGKQFSSLLVSEQARTNFSKEIAATAAGRPTRAYETSLLHRDGAHRWLIWNAQRLDDFDGAPAVLAVGQDYTERREAQERLLRSERLAGIGQMVTGIAHESRNALQRIQSCSEMLELEIEGNEEAMRLVRRIEEAQDHLLRLFEEVRGFVAPIHLERSVCRLDAVWREAWQLLERARRERDASLVENIDGVELNVDADRFRLLQVFRNLFENSLAAACDPVVIRIGCRDLKLNGKPALEISVRDNGPGITPEARQNVFEPFFTTKTKGTGLGMAIARRVIDAHGGRMAVGDSAEGAEFVISLPK
jgi:PAS domain S-box-containing protein